jgi:hypothetical protein
MTHWTLEGRPRTGRRYSTYINCPLLTAEDRLLFILVYLKQAATQSFHGAAFGMGQPKANQWIHTLLPVLRTTLATLGDLPSRNLAALCQRLAELSAGTIASPFFTMALNGQLCDPRIRMNKGAVIAARKSATQ